MSGASGRATLRLGADCNNHCIFCAQAGLADAAQASLESDIFTLANTSAGISFVGGEPMLSPLLEAAVGAARAAGFTAIGVQSNGTGLADAGVAHKLALAGLTDAHFSLHGPDAAVHDYHTATPGSFERVMAALGRAGEARLALAVTTVLTRSNFRSLFGIPALLKQKRVETWLIEVPHVAGRASAAFDRVIPRLGVALPFALHALNEARRIGLAAFVRGAPACLLGPLANLSLPDEPRAFAEVCGACGARNTCTGVDPAYLERFGGDELKPRDATPAMATHPAANGFVGVGPKLPGDAPKRHGGVRSLPVLGRVQPGAAEVARREPRRSGDDLRQILPALFEGNEDS